MERFRGTGVLLLAMLLAATIGLAGCGAATEGTDAGATAETTAEVATMGFPVTVVDDAGREVTIDEAPERIVSLAPANTEILYSLGLLEKLVGVTTYDDYPPEVSEIEAVGDFVGPNLEAVAAAAPDLVLATTGVQADVLGQLEAAGAIVLAIDPQTLEELYAAIEMVGAATGAGPQAAEVVADMRDEVASITEIVHDAEAVSCFVEIAQEPLFTVGEGTLIDELVALAGGVNVATEPGYVGYSVEQLLADDPQVYLATLGSMGDPAQLAERPGFDELTAVEGGRVSLLTDNLVSRPGPRIVEGLLEIATALHPDLFGDAS